MTEFVTAHSLNTFILRAITVHVLVWVRAGLRVQVSAQRVMHRDCRALPPTPLLSTPFDCHNSCTGSGWQRDKQQCGAVSE
eukprot:COSAG05_NODE_9285_length_634_cov_2.009346_2_plen_80_part_01